MALAFVDDSGSGGDSAYFVLGGYVGATRVWEAFIKDWQQVLDIHPKLSYFKMSEAESRKSCFSVFSAEERDARLGQFIDVILSHDIREACIAISFPDYEAVLEPALPKSVSSPYYFAFMAMVTALSGYYRHFDQTKETVDFVFDRQQGKETRANNQYALFRLQRPGWNLGGVAYKTDHTCLPLQAADLIAWQNRRFLCTKEPKRIELIRLHSDPKRWFRKTVGRNSLLKMVSALKENLPNLRNELGDEEVNRHLDSIRKKASRSGKVSPV